MATLPADIDFVLNPQASPARMNLAMALLHARISALELPAKTFADELEQLQTIGLERINDALQPYYQQLAAAVEQYVTLTSAQTIDGGTLPTPNTRIALRRSNVPGELPTSLLEGELALNEADGLLYWPDATGTIRSLSLVNIAHLSSPAFTDMPTAPTVSNVTDSSDRIATTAFAQASATMIVNAAITAFKAGVDPAYDTLLEIAAKLTADDTALSGMLTALANRVRVDANGGYTTAQQSQGRANLGVDTATLNKSAAYKVLAADYGALIKCSGTWTLTFDAAATLGDKFKVFLRNTGTGLITIDPNSAELIDGQTTIVLLPGTGCWVCCDGTGFFTAGRSLETQSLAANGYLKLASGLIFQWGSATGNAFIVYPVVFPTGLLAPPVATMTGDYASTLLLSISTAAYDNVGCNFRPRYMQGGTVDIPGDPYSWFAIGR